MEKTARGPSDSGVINDTRVRARVVRRCPSVRKRPSICLRALMSPAPYQTPRAPKTIRTFVIFSVPSVPSVSGTKRPAYLLRARPFRRVRSAARPNPPVVYSLFVPRTVGYGRDAAHTVRATIITRSGAVTG